MLHDQNSRARPELLPTLGLLSTVVWPYSFRILRGLPLAVGTSVCRNPMLRHEGAVAMGKHKIKPNYRRRLLRLPDLDHCKRAVLNSLGSPASRRVYEVTPISGQKPSSPQPLLPATAPRRVRVNSEVEAESLVYLVTPELPHEAQVANVSGTVVLHGVIGIDGRLHDLRYVSGPPLLAQAAIDTVTWWQYRVNGENVEVETTIPVVFPAAPTSGTAQALT